MADPRLNDANAFLIRQLGASHSEFVIAFTGMAEGSGGHLLSGASYQSGALAEQLASASLFNITVTGDTTDQAIRNWRRVAYRMTSPSYDPHPTRTQTLQSAVDTLDNPDLQPDNELCRLACETILRESRNAIDRGRAQMVLNALPAGAGECAA